MAPLKEENTLIATSRSIEHDNMPAIKTVNEETDASIKYNQSHEEEEEKAMAETRRGNPNVRRGMNRRRAGGGLRKRMNRSRSAPPVFNRNSKKHSLVQQHFKIDHKNQALLPGVPVHDDDFARDMHDFFNLIVLVPIVVLNVLNWDWDALLYGTLNAAASGMSSDPTKSQLPFLLAWTGEYFNLFFWTTVAYFLTDLIWVCVIPRCVKSPSTIIQHHIAVFAYLIIPYCYPNFRFLMGVCMSVELNTWFLIARRVFNKQGLPPWKFDIPYFISVRVKLISIFFYITWIMIRCLMYPYVLYVLIFRLLPHKLFSGTRNVILVAIILQSAFCYLNAQWSLQLLNSKIRQWKNNGQTKIESGL